MKSGRPFCMRAIAEKRACVWQCAKCGDRRDLHDLIALAVIFVSVFVIAMVWSVT